MPVIVPSRISGAPDGRTASHPQRRETVNVQTIDAAARDVLSLPDVFELPALIAVGYPGELDDLPEDYRARENPRTGNR